MSISQHKELHDRINAILAKGKCHVHLAGILGVSMSALAEILLERGYMVTGSDTGGGRVRERLNSLGIRISWGNTAELLSGAELLVYSFAIGEGAPERVYARDAGITECSRAELLGVWMKDYSVRVGVSGTHGKSTTTAMIGGIFSSAGLNPTILGGAEISCGRSYISGGREHLIYEACEYMDAFLAFSPTLSVITGVELDHTDYFKSREQLNASFLKSADSADAVIIFNGTDLSRVLIEGLGKRAITYGFCDAEYTCHITAKNAHGSHFTLMHRGYPIAELYIATPGEHNVLNATAAAAAAITRGVDIETIEASLRKFSGIPRRLEYIGDIDGTCVYYDYAHHPTEIAALYSALRTSYSKIHAIFKPHTYTRTRDLWGELVSALGLFDAVYITDIYAAREMAIAGVTSSALAGALPHGYYIPEGADAMSAIYERPDALVIMGAGDYGTLLSKIKERIDKK